MIKDWNFLMKNVYTCTCRSSADGCPRVSPKIPFYKLIAIYFKHLWYIDIYSCVSPNLFMNKQEMNRSFAFAFADQRQQVLDIGIRLALQCLLHNISLCIISQPLNLFNRLDKHDCLVEHKLFLFASFCNRSSFHTESAQCSFLEHSISISHSLYDTSW